MQLWSERLLQELAIKAQTSKQNITRDAEIKNKLTVTRGKVGGVNGEEEKGKGFQEHV